MSATSNRFGAKHLNTNFCHIHTIYLKINFKYFMQYYMCFGATATFGVICMTFGIVLLCICKRLLNREQNKNISTESETNKYNMTVEMIEVASICDCEGNQNNITNISEANATPSYVIELKDTKTILSAKLVNHISSKSNDALVLIT